MKDDAIDVLLGRPIEHSGSFADRASSEGRIDPDRQLLWIARSEKPRQPGFRPGPDAAASHLVELGPDRIERQVHLPVLPHQQFNDSIGKQGAVGLHLQLASMLRNEAEHSGDFGIEQWVALAVELHRDGKRVSATASTVWKTMWRRRVSAWSRSFWLPQISHLRLHLLVRARLAVIGGGTVSPPCSRK